MDALQAFLEELKGLKVADGHLLGLLHILIGRTISTMDGKVISKGMTWRELANNLKKVRWPKDAVREIGLEADDLAPRDREKMWYLAISRARVASQEARIAGDKLGELLHPHGYQIGPAPSQS